MLARLKPCLPAVRPWSWERHERSSMLCRQAIGKAVKNPLKPSGKWNNGGNCHFVSEPSNFSMKIRIMIFLYILSMCVEWCTWQVRALLWSISVIHQANKMKLKSNMMRIRIWALPKTSFTWVTGTLLGISNSIIAMESIVTSVESHQHRNRVVGTEHLTGARVTTWGPVGQPSLNQHDLVRAETLSIVFL